MAAHRRRASDAGMTLIELLVTISLSTVLGIVVVFAVQNNHQVHRTTIEESTGLADAKTVVERIGRDIRAATAVGAAATSTRLVLWTDTNGDRTQQVAEVTTWELVAGGGTGFVLQRTQSGQPTQASATTVNTLTFCYVPSGDTVCLLTPSATKPTTTVRTTLGYDARTGSGLEPRTETFTSTLRNAG